jgi:hypothetical protein
MTLQVPQKLDSYRLTEGLVSLVSFSTFNLNLKTTRPSSNNSALYKRFAVCRCWEDIEPMSMGH